MLDFIYYPVSAILWFWHEVFGRVPGLGMDSGIAWALSVVFLVFTTRMVLLKPFITQVRSMRKMQEFAPEIQKLKKKYGDDRQKMAAEMQKLQSEHGFNPMGGCLPMVVQIPVFIGIFHVLRSFNRVETLGLTVQQNRSIPNYVFSAEEVRQFLDARLFGVPLSGRIVDPSALLAGDFSDVAWQAAIVVLPLTILAGILTHITARHSISRQSEAQSANPQAAIMNRVMLYVFPLGIVVAGPFFPLGIIFYWLSNNTWTLGQQRVIYNKIDTEEAEKKEAAVAQRQNLGPRPGQKPQRPKKGGTAAGPAQPAPSDDREIEDGGVEEAGTGDDGRGSAAVSGSSAAGNGSGGAVNGSGAKSGSGRPQRAKSVNGGRAPWESDRTAQTRSAKKSNRKRR